MKCQTESIMKMVAQMGTLCAHFEGGSGLGTVGNFKKPKPSRVTSSQSRLITLNYLPNLLRYFVAKTMIHFRASWPNILGVRTSQSCQLLPSVKFKFNPLSPSRQRKGAMDYIISRNTPGDKTVDLTGVESSLVGQPRGSCGQ